MEVTCALCQLKLKSISQHLRFKHNVLNIIERRLIINMIRGKVRIDNMPCPVCNKKMRHVEVHMRVGHKDLKEKQRAQMLKGLRQEATKGRLQALSATNPIVPLATQWGDAGLKMADQPADQETMEEGDLAVKHSILSEIRKLMFSVKPPIQEDVQSLPILEEQLVATPSPLPSDILAGALHEALHVVHDVPADQEEQLVAVPSPLTSNILAEALHEALHGMHNVPIPPQEELVNAPSLFFSALSDGALHRDMHVVCEVLRAAEEVVAAPSPLPSDLSGKAFHLDMHVPGTTEEELLAAPSLLYSDLPDGTLQGDLHVVREVPGATVEELVAPDWELAAPDWELVAHEEELVAPPSPLLSGLSATSQPCTL
ncbi:uncharacterized protein [Misgurnus anguillicaudatus]|uniref:uncharacterized protein isoform X2 n=1 Tax=Misgurnus anguillicaudatus TaxID=75329 RepID=UPI003CCFC004